MRRHLLEEILHGNTSLGANRAKKVAVLSAWGGGRTLGPMSITQALANRGQNALPIEN